MHWNISGRVPSFDDLLVWCVQNSGNCALRCMWKCMYILSLDGWGGECLGTGQCLREVTWQVTAVTCVIGLTSDSISLTRWQKAPYTWVFVEQGLSLKSHFPLASYLVYNNVLSIELRRPVRDAALSSTVSGVGVQSMPRFLYGKFTQYETFYFPRDTELQQGIFYSSVTFMFIISVFQSYRTCEASTTAYGGFPPRRYGYFPTLVLVVFSVGKIPLGQTSLLVTRFYPVQIIPPLLHIHVSSI